MFGFPNVQNDNFPKPGAFLFLTQTSRLARQAGQSHRAVRTQIARRLRPVFNRWPSPALPDYLPKMAFSTHGKQCKPTFLNWTRSTSTGFMFFAWNNFNNHKFFQKPPKSFGFFRRCIKQLGKPFFWCRLHSWPCQAGQSHPTIRAQIARYFRPILNRSHLQHMESNEKHKVF